MKHKPGDDVRRESRRHPLITRLLAERVVLGLTRKSVADAAGISRNTLETMESGKRGPSLHTFEAYARGMGYRVTLQPMEEEGMADATHCPYCGGDFGSNVLGHIHTAHPEKVAPRKPRITT